MTSPSPASSETAIRFMVHDGSMPKCTAAMGDATGDAQQSPPCQALMYYIKQLACALNGFGSLRGYRRKYCFEPKHLLSVKFATH